MGQKFTYTKLTVGTASPIHFWLAQSPYLCIVDAILLGGNTIDISLWGILFLFFLNFTPFSPQFRGIRARERRRGRDEGWKSCFLTQRASNPEASLIDVSEETPCTWQPWLVCTVPGPPQESLVRDETRISLPANPSLTRTTLGQLCVAPRTSRSRPVTTEPRREPRVSGGTAGAAVERP